MQSLIALFSAIALLVWGTHMVRTGFLRVYGANLRKFLRASTGSRLTALAAGIGVTGLVGSLTRNPGTAGEEPINAMVSGVPIHAGDLFQIVAPSGGGFGNPRERDPLQVREDVLDGFTTLEQAREVYGVVLDEETLDVDLAGTTALREHDAAEREQPAVGVER